MLEKSFPNWTPIILSRVSTPTRDLSLKYLSRPIRIKYPWYSAVIDCILYCCKFPMCQLCNDFYRLKSCTLISISHWVLWPDVLQPISTPLDNDLTMIQCLNCSNIIDKYINCGVLAIFLIYQKETFPMLVLLILLPV